MLFFLSIKALNWHPLESCCFSSYLELFCFEAQREMVVDKLTGLFIAFTSKQMQTLRMDEFGEEKTEKVENYYCIAASFSEISMY